MPPTKPSHDWPSTKAKQPRAAFLRICYGPSSAKAGHRIGTIYVAAKWTQLADKLVIENMDKRKPIGRTASEMNTVFDALPQARFCFDIGHARQVDPTMTEASLFLRAFGKRLEQVHISEVNTASRHDPISPNAVTAFQSVAMHIPEPTPIILETLIDSGQSDIATEIARAREALQHDAYATA